MRGRRDSRERRGPWYLLTGLLIGAAIGLAAAIFLFPVNYVNTDPSALKGADRDRYRALVARAYLVEADNGRAFARLALLKDVSSAEALVAQAQRSSGTDGDESLNRALALLAAAVTQNQLVVTPLPRLAAETLATPTVMETAKESVTPTSIPPTRTTGPTITPRPTATPQPTQGAPYELLEQKDICEAALPGNLIQVYVVNAEEEPVPGVRVEVSITNGGVEAFYTGLYPQISAGYADYAMVEGMTYNLRVGEAGQLVQNLSIPECRDEDGKAFPGSLRLVFKQPK